MALAYSCKYFQFFITDLMSHSGTTVYLTLYPAVAIFAKLTLYLIIVSLFFSLYIVSQLRLYIFKFLSHSVTVISQSNFISCNFHCLATLNFLSQCELISNNESLYLTIMTVFLQHIISQLPFLTLRQKTYIHSPKLNLITSFLFFRMFFETFQTLAYRGLIGFVP